jgi:gas vesicle protein
MVNDNYEHENNAHEPGGSLAGLLAGLLIGLLIGGLTGAVAMLLVAPQSGKRTRAKLYRQGAEWREQAADTMEDAVESARDKARQITHDVSKAG